MSTRGYTFATLLAAALAAGCAAPDDRTGGGAAAGSHLRLGDVSFEPCSLSAAGAGSVEAQCARFPVPEDHDAPDGRRIELAIALVPARGQAEPDPVVMISGGPGQSALETYPQLTTPSATSTAAATCCWSTPAAPAAPTRCTARTTRA